MKAEELLQEPIENALYSTGKFTTDECEQLAEGIIQYIIDAKALEQYADEVSRDEYEKGFCDGKKARMGRHKNFWA